MAQTSNKRDACGLVYHLGRRTVVRKVLDLLLERDRLLAGVYARQFDLARMPISVA
jgi:hypothetical protein